MRPRASHNVSYPLEALPLAPLSSPDILKITKITDDSDVELPLMETKLPSGSPEKSVWLADIADVFVLWCSLLLIATSIVHVALVLHTQVIAGNPSKTFSTLQRVISSLSLAVTSAVIIVAGKRYVLFKFARGGLRSRRVAVYSNPTVGNLASYVVLHGAELPLLGLLAVWGLALATGLTVNDSWEMASTPASVVTAPPSGLLDLLPSNSSWVDPAIEQLSFVMSSWCLGLANTVGLINITGNNMAIDPNHQMGIIYYPPLPSLNGVVDYSFSTSTTMNGFNISITQLSSIPATAQNLRGCVQSIVVPMELWTDGSDNQTMSIVVVDEAESDPIIYQVNATAIIMGGTLSSFSNYTEFVPNGTSWPNVMSTGNRWAEDVVDMICNTTVPSYMGTCSTFSSLSDFAAVLNTDFSWLTEDARYGHWSTILNMALGAYSSVVLSASAQQGLLPFYGPFPVKWNRARFMSNYGTFILLANIVVSLVMLVIVVKLRLASHLGPDFINSTRLLLDPLRKPELFNASLQMTVDALADPYMLVVDDTLLLAERKLTKKPRMRFRLFTSTAKPSDRTLR